VGETKPLTWLPFERERKWCRFEDEYVADVEYQAAAEEVRVELDRSR
jgi:hypothetical protein